VFLQERQHGEEVALEAAERPVADLGAIPVEPAQNGVVHPTEEGRALALALGAPLAGGQRDQQPDCGRDETFLHLRSLCRVT
jgi:hypothetical protein